MKRATDRRKDMRVLVSGSGRPTALLLVVVGMVLVAVALMGLGPRARGMEGLDAAGTLHRAAAVQHAAAWQHAAAVQRAAAWQHAAATQRATAPGPMALGASPVTTDYVYLPLVFVPPQGLADMVTQRTIALPHSLAGSTASWCTWGGCTIGPRLYHEPLADGRTMVGWTDSGGTGHVSLVSGSAIETTYDFSGQELRGLAVHADGKFAVLLWNPGTEVMTLSKRGAGGRQLWATNLNSSYARWDEWLGGSRLAYGNGLYAAYFTVYGTSSWPEGHHGDQLTYVNDAGVKQSGGWDWGCSHSMAQLVSYHPDLSKFAPVCASDFYPEPGIMANHTHRIYLSDGNGGGLAAAQLGGMALAGGGWKVVFNALDRPCCTGKGIGLATIDTNYGGQVTWLTDTDGAYERDPVLGRLGTSIGSDRYVAGWTTTNNGAYWLGIMDGGGSFLRGPEDVTAAGVRWGNRDDSFRTRADGTVSWVYGEPLGSQILLFQLDGGAYLP